jgi:hypothetical protein
MRFISDKSLHRPGYISKPAAGGGFIEYPAGIEPEIVWNHIDGPLLYTSDCGLEWLSLWDRIQFKLGLIDINGLDRKYQRSPQVTETPHE